MSQNDSATAQRPRRILVDDSSENIQYIGYWTTNFDENNEVGDRGPPLERTVHRLSPNSNGSIVFEYEGSSIDAYGTVTSQESFDADWDCRVDDVIVGNRDTASRPTDGNHYKLCEWTSSTYGRHRFILTARSRQASFLLDYLRFVPSPEYQPSSIRNLIQIPDTDAAIDYTGRWVVVPDFVHLTRTPDSSATLSFVGSSLEWYGYTPDDFPRSTSMGSYTLDGSSSTSFRIPGTNGPDETTQYNQLVFKTPQLAFGQHNITVTYHGRRSSAPLTLNYLIVENRTFGIASSSAFPPPTTTNFNQSTPVPVDGTGTNRPNAGVIAGAVIGSLGGIALIALLVFLLRRWIQKRNLPMIQPLPGFVKPEVSAPLDIDLVNTRLSDEFIPGSRPGSFPYAGHARRRSAVRRFNPEVRSTISSVNLNPPPVQHAPSSTTNTGDNDSIVETPRANASRPDTSSNSQLDPYSAGYPYANMQLADYQKLVEATKVEEARAEASKSKARASYM